MLGAAAGWLQKHAPAGARALDGLDFGTRIEHATPAALALWDIAALLQQHAARLQESQNLPKYIPADDVGPEMKLTQWAKEPILAAPWLCQLCGDEFVNRGAWRNHCSDRHGGEAEYRKRVAYLHELAPPRVVQGQEKRSMVQSFAEFQTHCVEGSETNDWVAGRRAPRQERACCFCARVDWLERRFRLLLFEACRSRRCVS